MYVRNWLSKLYLLHTKKSWRIGGDLLLLFDDSHSHNQNLNFVGTHNAQYNEGGYDVSATGNIFIRQLHELLIPTNNATHWADRAIGPMLNKQLKPIHQTTQTHDRKKCFEFLRILLFNIQYLIFHQYTQVHCMTYENKTACFKWRLYGREKTLIKTVCSFHMFEPILQFEILLLP